MPDQAKAATNSPRPLTFEGLAAQWRAEADATWSGENHPRNYGEAVRRDSAKALRACADELTDAAAEWEHRRREAIVSAIFACGSEDCPRPFALSRHQDVTGVSGTGTVAHGTQFTDGTVVIRWLGDKPSTVVWASLDDAMAVHGHDGKTQVVWVATDFSEMALAEQEAAAAERQRIRQRLGDNGDISGALARELGEDEALIAIGVVAEHLKGDPS